jgi:plastocyanin
MTRLRVLGLAAMLVLGATAFVWAAPAVGSDDDDAGRAKRIVIRDDCDPRDPAWEAIGGCERRRGDVSRAEFAGENSSPLSLAVVGHQAWRNDPSYLEIKEGDRVRITNRGGRVHTFTRVEQFGGGSSANPAINKGLVMSPECPGAVNVAPGDRVVLSDLPAGNHRFICCIHPWMRALIKVKPDTGQHQHH